MKKILRTFVLILTVTLLFSCGRAAEKRQDPVDHYVAPAAEPPTSVTAEPQEIQIFTADDFFAIDPNSQKSYIVMNDIDFSGRSESLEQFNGTLDGSGYSFRNVQFGNLIKENNGEIRNLSVYCAIEINGGETYISVAGLVHVNYGTIRRCSSYGSITVSAQTFASGGLCWENDGPVGSILECRNFADISSTGEYVNLLGNKKSSERIYIGGICCFAYGRVEKCTNHGTISSYGIPTRVADVGGICSHSSSSENGSIRNCLNDGKIQGGNGICGLYQKYSAKEIQFEKCVNFGQIGKYYAAICGRNEFYIQDCYFLISACESKIGVGGSQDDAIHIIGLSEKEMKLQSFFPALDFENDWIMTETGPQLRFELELQANDQNKTTP